MDSLSAPQLASLSGLGGLLLAGGFLLIIPFHGRLESAGWLLRLGLIFVSLVGGAALNFIADARLREGLKENRWTGAELAPLRQLLESAPAKAASWSLLVLGIACTFLFSHRYSLGWAALILSQTLSGLRTSTRPPRPPIEHERLHIDWCNLQALRSELWGGR